MQTLTQKNRNTNKHMCTDMLTHTQTKVSAVENPCVILLVLIQPGQLLCYVTQLVADWPDEGCFSTGSKRQMIMWTPSQLDKRGLHVMSSTFLTVYTRSDNMLRRTGQSHVPLTGVIKGSEIKLEVGLLG